MKPDEEHNQERQEEHKRVDIINTDHFFGGKRARGTMDDPMVVAMGAKSRSGAGYVVGGQGHTGLHDRARGY